MAYYHPRTGADAAPTIEYARVLESTSREVRQIVSAEEEAPIMPRGIKTLHNLLFRVLLNRDIPVDKILSLRPNGVDPGVRPEELFEGTWKIVFALGLVPGYEGARICKGKVEERLTCMRKTKILGHLDDRVHGNIKTSSLSGASDITLVFDDDDTDDGEGGPSCATPAVDESVDKPMYVFCSSKFYTSDKKKSVDSYDIANIIAAANYNGFEDNEFRIVLLVKNKDVVKGKFATAYRRYLTYIVQPEEGRDGVLGRDDLEAAIVRLRERVGDSSDPEGYIQTVLLGGVAPPRFLDLRFHQELIVRKTLDIQASKTHDSVLWGVVARGGKTYMCGGLIRDMMPRAKYVFIVAGAYTETHTQFLDDLLDVRKNGFQDFAEYTAVNVRDDDKFEFDAKKKYIFFISAELLKAFVEGKSGKKARERTVMSLVQNRIIIPELVFFDEVHKGGTTSLADDAMSLISGDAFKVFMTATYNKLFIKDEYGITQDNFLTWGYEDIQMAKGLESTEVVDMFGTKYGKDICDRVINSQIARGNSLADIARQYQKFPELQFLTTTFSDTFRTSMQKQNILDPTAGFRMNTLLATGPDCMQTEIKKRYRCFLNPASVGVLLNYIAPHTAQLEKVGKEAVSQVVTPRENIMTRIGITSQRRGDVLSNVHTEFRPHSQLWFLPQPTVSSDETPLLSRMTAFGSLIMKHPWFSKHFCVVAVSSGFRRDETTEYPPTGFLATTNGGTDTKKTILELEKKAYAAGRGLIILAVKMLTLGVSLPCVNVVALLDDSQSTDLTYQKMFRALTESNGKKIGYIVDVNPVRTLKTLYDYTKVEHDASAVLDDAVDATVLTNLYLIDEDQLFVIDKEKRVTPDQLNKEIEKYLMAGRKSYKSIVDEASVKIASVDLSAELSSLMSDLRAVKPSAIEVASRLAGDIVPSGMEVVKAEKPKKKGPSEPGDETKEKLQALREMILTTMTLLAFLTTTADFAEALDYYKSDVDNIQDIVHSVLVDRGLTSAPAKTKIRDALIAAISKVQPHLTQPYGKMRAKLSELSGDQKDVIGFIEQNLRPKREQVAARGEVFTPLELVEDMLDHLPDDVWNHPEYKWLDPSNGIGNFPVVAFAKLDARLRTIPGYEDDAIRRKHIVENMLYMVELDDANIRLSRRLLEKMCGDTMCKFNLLKQDFLLGNIRTAFGVDGFHVCMANPPYNPPKTDTGSSGNAIWPHFVMKMESLLHDGGYIVAVHPPGWKKAAGSVYKPEKFASGDYKHYDAKEKKWKMYEVQQGQVWQHLKANGSFSYVYTNDQRSKTLEFWPNFPAVDYYVFHKHKAPAKSDVRNLFLDKEFVETGVVLNTSLPYLPCLLTTETIAILTRVLQKAGPKPSFKAGIDPRKFTSKEKGENTYMYDSSAKGPNYAKYAEGHETLTMDKVVLNYNGGVDGYYSKFIKADEAIGVLHHTMYQKVDTPELGSSMERFFNSDVAKFIFLITQYSFGQRTQNEMFVANSITLPTPDTVDYYAFFGIDEFKPFIESTLGVYAAAKAPKKRAPAATSETPRRKKSPNGTLRNKSKE